ncbi:MAG: serine hydrolase [Nitrososphaera sp.]
MEDNSEGGTVGLYLKEVNASVLAAYNEGFIFEPASAIKALIHFHAMRQVQDGAVINSEVVTLSTQIPWFSDGGPDDCPSLTGPASDTLSNGLEAMMGPSDNRWTQAMRDFFGDANIDATRQQFGMTDSALLHMIGCGGPPPNQLTLVDAGKMYESVATGFLNPTIRAQAYGLMDNRNAQMNTMIEEEAVGLGLSSEGITSFKSLRNSALKKGDYGVGGLLYRTAAGWAQIPFKDETCSIDIREYVYGAFISGATTVADGFSVRATSVELLREQIRFALESWAECEADLEIQSFDASTPPGEVLIGESFQVNLTKMITNNGPASAADVDVSVSSSAPGLAVDPISAGGIVPDLELGEVAEVNESFELTCDEHGMQEVTFTNNIEPINKVDPDLSNNVAEVSVGVECVIPVQINIRPGSFSNPVNLKSHGAIPLAILTTAEGEYGLPVAIDATMIDPLSVLFGTRDALLNTNSPGGATETHGTDHPEDTLELDEVTSDGDLDMILHFKSSESGLVATDTEACVMGEISIGGSFFTFFGCDNITIVS